MFYILKFASGSILHKREININAGIYLFSIFPNIAYTLRKIQKLCGKAQFPKNSGRIARDSAKTVHFHKILRPWNLVKKLYFAHNTVRKKRLKAVSCCYKALHLVYLRRCWICHFILDFAPGDIYYIWIEYILVFNVHISVFSFHSKSN